MRITFGDKKTFSEFVFFVLETKLQYVCFHTFFYDLVAKHFHRQCTRCWTDGDDEVRNSRKYGGSTAPKKTFWPILLALTICTMHYAQSNLHYARAHCHILNACNIRISKNIKWLVRELHGVSVVVA